MSEDGNLCTINSLRSQYRSYCVVDDLAGGTESRTRLISCDASPIALAPPEIASVHDEAEVESVRPRYRKAAGACHGAAARPVLVGAPQTQAPRRVMPDHACDSAGAGGKSSPRGHALGQPALTAVGKRRAHLAIGEFGCQAGAGLIIEAFTRQTLIPAGTCTENPVDPEWRRDLIAHQVVKCRCPGLLGDQSEHDVAEIGIVLLRPWGELQRLADHKARDVPTRRPGPKAKPAGDTPHRENRIEARRTRIPPSPVIDQLLDGDGREARIDGLALEKAAEIAAGRASFTADGRNPVVARSYRAAQGAATIHRH
jgi:hypothetical protein